VCVCGCVCVCVCVCWTEAESRLGRKWNIVDDLPDMPAEDEPLPPRSTRHRRPNTEYDSDLVT